MLFLLPVILFSLTALGVVGLRLRVTRMAYIWLIITLVVSISWIIFMILPVSTISTAFTLQWMTLPDSVVQLQFGLIPMTWGFTLLLISLALGYFLTLPVWLENEKRSLLWIAWLIALTFAFLFIAARNLVSLIIAWTFLDLLDLVFSFFVLRSDTLELPLIPVFLPRIFSTLILVIATVTSSNGGLFPVDSNNLTIAILVFLAGFLRSGIFTAERAVDEKGPGKSFSNLLNWLFAISALLLWSQLPDVLFDPLVNQLLLALLMILAIISTINFLLRRKNGSKYRLSIIIFLAAVGVLSGEPKSALSWVAILITVETLTNFYAKKVGGFPIVPILLIATISGLPLTSGFFALSPFFTNGINGWGIIGIILYVIFLITIFSQLLEIQETPQSIEPWYQAVYFIGLFILLISPFVLIVKGVLPTEDWLPFWWIGAVSVILFTMGILLRNSISKRAEGKEKRDKEPWIQTLKIADNLFLKTDRISEAGRWIGLILQEFIDLLTKLLEGEGGVIWAIVLLALLVSLIGTGGA